MRQDDTPDMLQARLDAVLRESKRLRAETVRVIEESRAWSDAVAKNIQEAPRWVFTNDPPDRVDSNGALDIPNERAGQN